MAISFSQDEVKEAIHFGNPLLPEEPLTIPGKDGDDAPVYLEKNIQKVLKKLELLEQLDQEKNEEGKA